MELAWDSRPSTPQETGTTNNSIQRRKRGLQVSLDNCDDVLCFLQDFGVLICREHYTAVVNLNTHLLQHHGVPAATQKQVIGRFLHLTSVNPANITLSDEPIRMNTLNYGDRPHS
jgi:hypothetical protein